MSLGMEFLSMLSLVGVVGLTAGAVKWRERRQRHVSYWLVKFERRNTK